MVEESKETIDSYYSSSALRSMETENLPSYTSKEKLVKMVTELAEEKFNTNKVKITDLYFYPSVDGIEIFYKLPNGIETNAFLVNRKFIGNIAVETDQLQIESGEYTHSKLIQDDDSVTVKLESLSFSENGSILFTCDNKSNCSPCKVQASMEKEIAQSEGKVTVRCGTCKGCSLKAELN